MTQLAITGRARTDRAERYLKQLVSHLGQKLDTTLEEGRGEVTYESATAVLTSTPESLEFALSAAEPLDLFRAMAIVQRHLEKFGAKVDLACEWDDDQIEADALAARAKMQK